MFDLNEIKERAESNSYTRGVKIAKSGHVTNLAVVGDTATAFVVGQQRYSVKITQDKSRADSALQVACSCPAASYQDVCKHAVAVAIKVSAGATQGVTTEKRSSDTIDKLRKWLAGKDKQQLIAYLLPYIEQDVDELDKWLLRIASEGGALPLAAVKKMITKALPLKSIWHWQEVSEYFDRAESVFESMFEALRCFSAEEQWSITLKSIQRLNKVLERIDDSGGYRFVLEEQINHHVVRIFSLLEWPNQAKAKWLYEQLTEDALAHAISVPRDFDLTDEVESLLLEMCNEKLLAKRSAADVDDFEQQFILAKVAAPLIEKSKESGNWREQCRVKALIANDSNDFLAISQLCLQHDAEFDAEDWLLKAKKVASSRYDESACELQEIEVLIALERPLEAWDIAWDRFEVSHRFPAYQLLEKLRHRIEYSHPKYLEEVEESLYERSITKNEAANVSIRIGFDDVLEFYLDQKMFDKARVWAMKHLASPYSLIILANQITENYPQEAIEFHRRAVAQKIEQGKNEFYQEAKNDLLNLQQLLQHGSHDLSAFNDMISVLAVQYKRKRNMMALLKENFKECF